MTPWPLLSKIPTLLLRPPDNLPSTPKKLLMPGERDLPQILDLFFLWLKVLIEEINLLLMLSTRWPIPSRPPIALPNSTDKIQLTLKKMLMPGEREPPQAQDQSHLFKVLIEEINLLLLISISLQTQWNLNQTKLSSQDKKLMILKKLPMHGELDILQVQEDLKSTEDLLKKLDITQNPVIITLIDSMTWKPTPNLSTLLMKTTDKMVSNKKQLLMPGETQLSTKDQSLLLDSIKELELTLLMVILMEPDLEVWKMKLNQPIPMPRLLDNPLLIPKKLLMPGERDLPQILDQFLLWTKKELSQMDTTSTSTTSRLPSMKLTPLLRQLDKPLLTLKRPLMLGERDPPQTLAKFFLWFRVIKIKVML